MWVCWLCNTAWDCLMLLETACAEPVVPKHAMGKPVVGATRTPPIGIGCLVSVQPSPQRSTLMLMLLVLSMRMNTLLPNTNSLYFFIFWIDNTGHWKMSPSSRPSHPSLDHCWIDEPHFDRPDVVRPVRQLRRATSVECRRRRTRWVLICLESFLIWLGSCLICLGSFWFGGIFLSWWIFWLWKFFCCWIGEYLSCEF